MHLVINTEQNINKSIIARLTLAEFSTSVFPTKKIQIYVLQIEVVEYLDIFIDSMHRIACYFN